MPTESSGMTRVMRSRWMLPIVCLVIGGAYMLAAGLGGKLELGAEMFGVAALFAVALVLGRRSETVRGFTQADARDERFAAIDLRATAIAGATVVVAILIGFIVALARGDNGEPYISAGDARRCGLPGCARDPSCARLTHHASVRPKHSDATKAHLHERIEAIGRQTRRDDEEQLRAKRRVRKRPQCLVEALGIMWIVGRRGLNEKDPDESEHDAPCAIACHTKTDGPCAHFWSHLTHGEFRLELSRQGSPDHDAPTEDDADTDDDHQPAPEWKCKQASGGALLLLGAR